jgi:hypothetical protein
MKRVELGYCAWNHYGLGRVAQYVGQKIRPRGSGEKRAEDELPSWRSMRSLMVKETALGLRSGSLARKGGTTTRSWSTRTWVSSRIEGVFCAKRSGGNGEKGARLQTRHYKSVKERRQERREGGLKSAAEAEHTPLTEEKKILPGLVQGRRRSQRRGGAEKKKILQENAPGSSGYAEDKFRPATTEAREERSVHGYGALAAGTPRSAMLSPFLREGTALTWRTTAETGARGSAMSLPV